MIDPIKPGTFAVSLGQTIQPRRSENETVYTSLKYNHKPCQTSSSRKTTIAPDGHRPGEFLLSLHDADEANGHYTYQGRRASKPASRSHILIYNPSIQAFSLEHVDTNLNLNLTSSPWQPSREELRQQYPQLGHGTVDESGDEGDLFGEEEDTSADDGNPYDYRQWLQGRRPSSPEDPRSSRAKPAAPSRSVIRGDTPKPRSKPKPKPAPKAEQPKQDVRDDYADDESSDDGGLVIEMGLKPPPRKTTGHTLNHERLASAGPISLRSAASSASPASRRWQQTSSDSDTSDDDRHPINDSVEQAAQREEHNIDVRLPSPVPQALGEDEADDDDDDELEAELAQALNSEDIVPEKVESESESEEE
ncbi:MAG: hypothetical protein M1817_001896 [Caeruleum heppii]|nr:MAG: hypothetical protein M1817_001896 [Caeruleum heppii]